MKITLSKALLRDPLDSETSYLRTEYVEDCDETVCRGHEADLTVPHLRVVLSGANPEAGPRAFFMKI